MSERKAERRGLGRGLSALMADVAPTPTPVQGATQGPETVVPIDHIEPNPDQPRRTFSGEALQDLANSIKEKGVIQPLIVRPNPNGPGFEIVAGERRWRAAQMARLHELPVIVREFDDTEVLEVAIIENIQRADLNAVEEAQGYRQLMDRFGHTQEKLAEALGKSRSHIANMLRLLGLPDEVMGLLRDGKISAGHARALLTAPDPVALARDVVRKGLSVREVEKLANAKPKAAKAPTVAPTKDSDTRALEADLAAALGMSVSIDHKAGGEAGAVRISYKSLDELDEVCRRLSMAGHVLAD